jgi:hypothetical protein
MKNTTRTLLAGLVAAAFIATPVLAQQKLKIGFISTFSAPRGDRRGHEEFGRTRARSPHKRKVGGLDTEVIYGDEVRPMSARRWPMRC